MKKLPFKSNVPKDFDVAKIYAPIKTEAEKEMLRQKANEQWQDEQSRIKAQQAQERRKLTGWNEKMIGNKNGAGNKGHKYRSKTEEEKKAMSEKMMGRVIPSITGVPKPKETCPHCGKIGGRPQMFQYHFDKCKFKKD